MTMHPIQKKLLQAIELYEQMNPEFQKDALRILRECSVTLNEDTLADIIWGSYIGWLNVPYEYSNPESLTHFRQELMGQSKRLFHAHFSKDFSSMLTEQERDIITHLLSMIDYLNEFQYSEDETKLSQKEKEYEKFTQRLSESSSLFPIVEHEFDEKIYHFVIRIAINTLQKIDPFTYTSRQNSRILYSGIKLIGDLMINGQRRYPSVTHDLAWMKNALWAIQGKTWLCFNWQIFPENVVFIVK
jgi:hypothetical protein